MNYGWGTWSVLSLAIVAGCGGGTTNDDAGTDAFVFPHDATRDAFTAPIPDGNVEEEPSFDANLSVDAYGADTSVDANVTPDTGSDAGHDGGTDAGTDAHVTPDGGCATIDGEIFANQSCGGASDDPCPTGFTCQLTSAGSHCLVLCSGIGGHCPCSSACIEHPAIEAAPAYDSCDEL